MQDDEDIQKNIGRRQTNVIEKIVTHFWSVLLIFAFQSARIIFSITKKRLRGALVFIWYQGRVMLIKKTYQKAWSIPGGLAKKGETRRHAAVREVLEEVGICLNMDDLVFIEEVMGDFGPGDKVKLYEVELDRPVEIKVDGKEIMAAEFVLPKVALKRSLYIHVKGHLKARHNL